VYTLSLHDALPIWQIALEDIAGDDGELGKLFREMFQPGSELRIQLDGGNRTARSKQMTSHFAIARAYFDPTMLVVAGKRNGGMRGDPNGAGNLFAPIEVREKMLAEALASHA